MLAFRTPAQHPLVPTPILRTAINSRFHRYHRQGPFPGTPQAAIRPVRMGELIPCLQVRVTQDNTLRVGQTLVAFNHIQAELLGPHTISRYVRDRSRVPPLVTDCRKVSEIKLSTLLIREARITMLSTLRRNFRRKFHAIC